MFNNYYTGKRVLVTGHTGFKGSWLSYWLLKLGAQVCGYSLYVPTHPSNFEALGLAKNIEDVEGDIRDLNTLLAVFNKFKPEIVFHMAAQSLVRKSYDVPKQTFDTNLGGTINLLEAVRQTSSIKSAVILTSDKCYENVETHTPYSETDLLGGKDPYSASKACAEIAFRAYYQSFLKNIKTLHIATARAGNVLGGGDWSLDRIIPDCMSAWSQNKSLPVRNPEATRPWQHVLDPLSGYLWLGAKLPTNYHLSGESFNFGPPSDLVKTVGELLDDFKKEWPQGKWSPSKETSSSKKEAGLLHLDCKKAFKELSWKATLNYNETVKMTAEWYKQYFKEKKDMKSFASQQISLYQEKAQQRGLKWTL